MRKIILPVLATATLALGGCASTGYGGGYGGGSSGGLLGGLLGGILGGGTSGYNNQNLNRFEQAGAQACGREASRYGQVNIRQVGQVSDNQVRVVGYVQTNRGSAEFDCSFRSDGQIVNFEIG